jgi:hypothetical protein
MGGTSPIAWKYSGNSPRKEGQRCVQDTGVHDKGALCGGSAIIAEMGAGCRPAQWLQMR